MVSLIVWSALVLLTPRPASASATARDSVIHARLPSVRASLQSSHLCTPVGLPADPLKLVRVIPAAVGSAADMLLYGAPHRSAQHIKHDSFAPLNVTRCLCAAAAHCLAVCACHVLF